MYKKNTLAVLSFLIFVTVCSAQPSPQDPASVVKNYLTDKTKNSGTFDIYDESIKKVRNLRVIDVPVKIEKDKDGFTAAQIYRDINSGEIVELQFLVGNKAGNLTVDEVKIGQATAITKEQPAK